MNLEVSVYTSQGQLTVTGRWIDNDVKDVTIHGEEIEFLSLDDHQRINDKLFQEAAWKLS